MYFGVQKPFEIQSRFWDVFFQLAPTSGGLRGDFDAAVSPPEPPRAAPFSRTEGSFYDPRDANTRSNTPWARGLANFMVEMHGVNCRSQWLSALVSVEEAN